MSQEIPQDLTLSALKIEPSSISTNTVLDVNGNMIGNRRNIITLNTATNRVLTVAESGSLINIDNSSDVEITIGLPTIEAGNIGTFYEFNASNLSATEKIEFQTGGHNTTINESNRTAAYDDFTGGLFYLEQEAGQYGRTIRQYVEPEDGQGTLRLDSNLTHNGALSGTFFRCTAISASTTAPNANVWLLEGFIRILSVENNSYNLNPQNGVHHFGTTFFSA